MSKYSSSERRIIDELRAFYGPDAPVFSGRSLARYHNPNVPYHVLFKTFQSRFFTNPDRKGELARITAGILSKALEAYRGVHLMTIRVMSNHVHMMVQGPAKQLPDFIGYFKKETNFRWAKRFKWKGTMWEAYASTALPTPEAQLACLKYIESNGVKEGLVRRPDQWPGLNCTNALLTGEPIEGVWFDGTKYGNEVRKQRKRLKPSPVSKESCMEPTRLSLTPIPALAHLTPQERRLKLERMMDEIVAEGHAAHAGNVLGADAIFRQSRMRTGNVDKPRWWTERARMVVWDDSRAPAVQVYLQLFWAFQFAFRVAADWFLAGNPDYEFPAGSFRPGVFVSAAARKTPPTG